MEPLLAITKGEFSWSPLCQRAFDSFKVEISQQPILKPFSLNLDSTLTVDASECAATGILSQGGHPIAFVSHSFTPEERNWSNIECEAYAVVWCTQ